MPLKNSRNWATVGLVGLFAACCLWIYIPIYEKEHAARCFPLPEGFSEEDLVGTWIAGVPDHFDKLIIQADGTYKQIIYVDFVDRPSINYESGWQPWSLSQSEENFTYLHLNGMSFCGMNPGISCNKRDGDGHDFCRDEYIEMLNEGILIVVASSDELLPGTKIPHYYISLNYPLGSQNSWAYSLQSPDQ